MNDNRIIAIYSRKSKLTEKGDSIKNQINMCKSYLSSSFVDLDKEEIVIFEDEGYSGSNVNRPEFQKMMTEVRANNIKMICCYRLDRISRNMNDLTSLVNDLDFHEVDFVSITEKFDTSTPTGRLMLNILSSFAQFERDSIAQRITDNKYELSKTGIWLGGKTPTGYRSEPVAYTDKNGKTKRYYRLELIENEAELIKYIYKMYIQMQSLTAVETHLLNEGKKTKTGKEFSRQTIKGILMNPVYMIADANAFQYYRTISPDVEGAKELFDGSSGMMIYNKTKQATGKTTKLKDESEWIIAVGEHEGIIPGKDWLRVKSILDRNSNKSYRRARSNPSLLSGIIRCGHCGAYMRPKMFRRTLENGDRSFSYLCETKDRSHKQQCDMCNADGNQLDGLVIDEILRISSSHEEYEKQLAKLRLRYLGNESAEEDISRINAEIEQKQREIATLVQAVKGNDNRRTASILSDEIEKLGAEMDELDDKKRSLSARKTNADMRRADYETVRQTLLNFRSFASSTPRERLSKAVRAVIDSMVWDGEKAHVYLSGMAPENAI